MIVVHQSDDGGFLESKHGIRGSFVFEDLFGCSNIFGEPGHIDGNTHGLPAFTKGLRDEGLVRREQEIGVKTFATGLRRPVDLRFATDGSLYVLLRDAWVIDKLFKGGTGALLRIRPAKK